MKTNGAGPYAMETQQSLTELYRCYYPKVYQTCFSYAKNQDDAFDLTHDIMLKVFSNIGAFEGKSSFSTWLFAITRNHCLSMMSKKRMLYHDDVYATHYLVAEELSPEELEKRANKEKLELELEHYLELLPASDKKMMELKYFHKYSVKDLQREFNLTASAVKMRLLRARQKIEQIIEVRAAA